MHEPDRAAQLEELHPVLTRLDLRTYLKELWARREFILAVPRNNLRAQNMDTALGNFWYLLNPALQTVVYFFVFGVLFKGNRGIPNYLGYLVIGVLTFNLIGQASTAAARCVVNNKSLIRSLYFPKTAIPLTSAIASIYTYLPGAAVMLVVAAATGDTPTLRWLFLPAILALTVLWVLGIVLVIARLGRSVPDLHSLLPHVIRLLFYLSGALFDPEVLDTISSRPNLLLVFNLNPFYELLSIWRWAILGRDMPDWIWMSISAWTFVTLILGFLFFWQAETSYGSER